MEKTKVVPTRSAENDQISRFESCVFATMYKMVAKMQLLGKNAVFRFDLAFFFEKFVLCQIIVCEGCICATIEVKSSFGGFQCR
jgi:hypothetical protein